MKYSEQLAVSARRGIELASKLEELRKFLTSTEAEAAAAARSLTAARIRFGDREAAGEVSDAARKDLAAALLTIEATKARLAGILRLMAERELALPAVLDGLRKDYAPWALAVAEDWVDTVCRPAERAFQALLEGAGVTIEMPPAVAAADVDPARVSQAARELAEAIATLEVHQARVADRDRLEQLNRKAGTEFQAARGKQFRVVHEFTDNSGRRRLPGEIVIAGQDVDLFSLQSLASGFGGFKLRAAE